MALDPTQFVSLLEKLGEESGVPFARLRRLHEAESAHSVAMQRYKGYRALSQASQCFFLETTERLNSDIRPRVEDPLPWEHALFTERLVYFFQALRGGELASTAGYSLQGYTILRNISDGAILTAAILLGLSTFSILEGLDENGNAVSLAVARKARRKEEWRVRKQMDGEDSGLSQRTIEKLKLLDDLYDHETHGGRLSQTFSMDWLKGKGPLEVMLSFSEPRASMFINRHVEVGWMCHRLLPCLQPTETMRFSEDWQRRWSLIDNAFEQAVYSMTSQLRKPVGEAVCELLKAKFPFTFSSTFHAPRP